MIKDFQLIKSLDVLFEKEIVIWGAGFWGQIIYRDIVNMGAGRKGVSFVDIDENKYNNNLACQVYSPQKLVNKDNDFIIIISVDNLDVQETIIKKIEEEQIQADIYTKYGFYTGLFLNMNDLRMNDEFRNGIEKRRLEEKYRYENVLKMQMDMEIMKYFTFAPIREQMILIYQPGKVGSKTIRNALEKFDKHVLHVHSFSEYGYNKDDIRKTLQKNNAKIITMVREPVARAMSDLWESLLNFRICNKIDANFDEIEHEEFSTLLNYQFDWFDDELKKVLGIDIYEYDFDPSKGYTMIEKDGISVLLLKTEKMNELQDVVGEFIGISNFEFSERVNEGQKKVYKYAYEGYKSQFKISRSVLEKWYKDNEKMNHFFSEEEKEYYIKKWSKYTYD